jgi:hypothetical protein
MACIGTSSFHLASAPTEWLTAAAQYLLLRLHLVAVKASLAGRAVKASLAGRFQDPWRQSATAKNS